MKQFNEWLIEQGYNKFTYKQIYTNIELFDICNLYFDFKLRQLKPDLEKFYEIGFTKGWNEFKKFLEKFSEMNDEKLNSYITGSTQETEILLNQISHDKKSRMS